MYSRALTVVAVAGAGFAAFSQLGARSATSLSRAAITNEGGPVMGPDVIVSRLDALQHYGNSGEIGGYSIATTSCNIGDELLEWLDEDPVTGEDNQNRHPVIAQNLYRLKDGRFEQVGMSWVKHGFCAADANDPVNCFGCTPQVPQDCDYLYPGCSDTYSTANNGSQFWLGPRSEIDATTGVYPYPYTIHWRTTSSDPTFKRIQVHNDDLDPAINTGARYYAEGQYITVDEQPWGTDDNNNAWREFEVTGPLSGGFSLGYIDSIRQQESAILAWQEADASVVIETVDIPNDGRVFVGYRVTDNLDGTWTYEYAINNYNSDRSIGRVSVPVDCAEITGIGFHDIDYHSGEPFDGTDWPGMVDSGELTWQTTDHATDQFANALRWGTLYNYRFTADEPPVAGELELGLFKPGGEGDPDAVAVAVQVPQPRDCPADIVGGDQVDVLDLLEVLGNWGDSGAADVTGSDGCPDGVVDVLDLLLVLGNWGPCP